MTVLLKRFAARLAGAWSARYNIVPRAERTHRSHRHRELVFVGWGLVPRGKKAHKSPAAGSMRGQCLLRADGFYEWQATGKHDPAKREQGRGGMGQKRQKSIAIAQMGSDPLHVASRQKPVLPKG